MMRKFIEGDKVKYQRGDETEILTIFDVLEVPDSQRTYYTVQEDHCIYDESQLQLVSNEENEKDDKYTIDEEEFEEIQGSLEEVRDDLQEIRDILKDTLSSADMAINSLLALKEKFFVEDYE